MQNIISQRLSDKMHVLSAICILLVLYIHCGWYPDVTQGMRLVHFSQGFVSFAVGVRMAVPTFFAISGFFFFLSVPNGLRSIGQKMLKRVRTLLIPYLIGCVFFVLFITALLYLPLQKGLVNNYRTEFFETPWPDILSLIFWGRPHGLIAFHLWFLRELMIMVIFAPVLWWLYKVRAWLPFAIAAADVSAKCLVGHSLGLDYFLWFTLGAAFTSKGRGVGLSCVERRASVPLAAVTLALYLCLCVFKVVSHVELSAAMNLLYQLFSVFTLWVAADLFLPADFSLRSHPILRAATSYTFFVYLFHEPTLNIVRKLLALALGRTNECAMLTSYLLSPWLFFALMVLVGALLRRHLPRLYGICTGGR